MILSIRKRVEALERTQVSRDGMFTLSISKTARKSRFILVKSCRWLLMTLARLTTSKKVLFAEMRAVWKVWPTC